MAIIELQVSVAVVIVIAAISFLSGFASHFYMSKHDLSIEKRVSMVIFVSWLSFVMIAYFQERELSLFFNAAGMGAVGNLIGIKTSELIGSIVKRK